MFIHAERLLDNFKFIKLSNNSSPFLHLQLVTAITKVLASSTVLKRAFVIAVMASLGISVIPVKKTITTLPTDVYVSITPMFVYVNITPMF